MSDNPFADALSNLPATVSDRTSAIDNAPPTPPATPQDRASAINPHPVSGADNNPFAAALASLPPEGAQQEEDQRVPDWSEIPGQAVSNLGQSTGNFVKNISQPFLHPINTAENIGNIGLGVMEKLGLYGSDQHEKYADAVGKMFMDRYGSVDNIKKTLAHDPVGALADVSALLSGAPGVVGKIGSAVDPLNAVTGPLKGAAKLAGMGTKEFLGWRAGTGPEAVGSAAKAGFEGGESAQAFRENIRQQVPLEGVVRDAQDAIHNIVENKNTNYKSGIAQAGLNQPISSNSFTKIAKGIMDAADIGQHKGWSSNAGALKANTDLSEIVHDFVYDQPHIHTVEGLDALKQAIGEYRQEHTQAGSKASVVANTYYNAVKDAIMQQAPAYGKVMEQYSEAKSLITQLQKSFSLPAEERKLNIDTALRKLQSVMRNNVNTNYGFRSTLVEMLEKNGAPNLKFSIAGQALNSKTPRGLAKISIETGGELAAAFGALLSGQPHVLALALGAFGISALTQSPRLIGESAYYAGRAASPLKYAPQVINKPMLRGAQQIGREENLPAMQSRGGSVDRALRTSRKYHG